MEFPYDSKVAINDPLIEEQNHDEANIDRVPPLIREAGDAKFRPNKIGQGLVLQRREKHREYRT